MSARNPSGVEFDRLNGFDVGGYGIVDPMDPPLEPRERFWDSLAAVANVIFAVALLPTIIAGAVLAPATSIATIVALCMLTAILVHYKLWWGAFFNVTCTSMWVILLIMAL